MHRFALVLLFAVGCGGNTPPAEAPKPAAETKVEAPAPAPVEVGPDGPTSIAVPASVPKTSAELPTDAETLAKGEATFTAKGCGACHAFGSKLVGPDLVGVTARRTPPWIARMILAPEVMIKEDPVAKQLYMEAMTPMAKQGVAEEDMTALLAFLASKK